MRYLSLFSGVDAATLAWEPLGWEPMAFAEIEPFPSAVLANRWPDVENLGDVTTVDWQGWLADCGRPDVMVAGSPCQAFSVAGNRMSLEDARGNLTLFTAELVRFLEPKYFIWENVPGALSTKDNAFGCLLGELVGAGEPLSPTGKRWTRAGLVSGPEASACWRVFDAQYFGLAQRRKRLYLVRCPRDGADPAEVLLECESLFGDPAPRREEGTRPAGSPARGTRGSRLLADTGVVRGLKSRFGTSGSDLDDAEAGHLVPDSKWWDGSDTAECLDVSKLVKQQTMPEKGRFAAVVEEVEPPIAFSCKDSGRDVGEVPPSLRAMNFDQTHDNAGGQVAVAFKPSHYTRGKDGSPSEVYPPLSADADKGDQDPLVLTGEDIADPVSSSEGRTYTHEGEHNFRLHNVVEDVRQVQWASGGGQLENDTAQALRSGAEHSYQFVRRGMAVRRLTPRECERLQGMPDDHTRIPWRGKAEEDCPDGPRYRAIGNSMAVPVMRWIGSRIDGQAK